MRESLWQICFCATKLYISGSAKSINKRCTDNTQLDQLEYPKQCRKSLRNGLYTIVCMCLYYPITIFEIRVKWCGRTDIKITI